ncbi:hypothetical protein CC1G_03796 [Coprinopsis cinerea okayama7|uniref:PEBP-like protein n=1 Tax=Coprinopsis cinerea (strain Okayama-7 / 130 / ATCC MYA-4618 / FGSC 9003) TaxID=240176 RepID=A8NGR4_COPC7|nr:hypothetical protein CC1G_03796 [Coprinopsis cinerea okayama7\|eukprot:XP_001833579.1 hypothetical protein CC1G_03796 [Coprinopsis cinerea okayama7\
MLTQLLLSVALLPFSALAQGDTSIAAIEAHFEQAHIVEDYLTSFSPSALLDLEYEGVPAGPLTPGQNVTLDQVETTPIVTITAPDGDALDGNYTLVMFDIFAVGSGLDQGVVRHWLVNSVTVDDDGAVDLTNGTVITEYGGPNPPSGSGAHRYIVALYEQPATFTPPEDFAEPLPLELFDWLQYVEDANLGPLVAANYFTVAVGDLPDDVPSTSAVESSTLGSGSPSPTSSSPTGSTSTDSNVPTPTSDDNDGDNDNDNQDDGHAFKSSVFSAPLLAIATGFVFYAM